MTAFSLPQEPATLSIEQELDQAVEKVLQLAVNHHQSGQIHDAESLYRAILQIQPNHPDANHNLGILVVQTQRPAAGLLYFEAALEARPEQEQYWLSYIEALIQADQLEIARQVLDLGRQHGLQGNAVENLAARLGTHPQAMQQSNPAQQCVVEIPPPTVPQSDKKQAQPKATRSGKLAKKKASDKDRGRAPSAEKINAVMALFGQGRITEAETLARSLTMRFPLHGFGWKALGAVLKIQGRVEEALLSMQKAVNFLPGEAEAHCNLGITLKDKSRLTEAEASLRRALALKPDYAEAHSNLGITLQDQGRLTEAEVSVRRAVALKPDYAVAHNNLGIILQNLSRLSEAETSLRRALEIQSNSAYMHSNLLFCLSQLEGIDAEALFAEHCRFGEQFEAPLRSFWSEHSNPRDPERCLQIGLVSGDLRNHAVANFIEPVLTHLAGNKKLSLHAYYNHTTEDSVTQRLRGYLTHWHSVVGLSDAAMEKKIRADGIDILIDLSGHTAYNRLLVFARKPAPVQASWMGYPGTTGLHAMDYYLTDHFLLPPGQFDRQFTEKLVYLPANAPFLPSADAPSVNVLPALANGYVTFGSFNRPSKLSLTIIALWSQLLRALPDARMLLGAMPEDGNNDTLIAWFAQEGIARDRLSFHPRSDMQAYLALHHQVDVCLDTFPYAGGTTTLHALWMGVPTLTLAGHTVAGRTGASILAHIGLEEFVARDAADFVQKGLFITGNIPSLAKLRARLRERFEQSPISRPEVIADGLERTLRTMWQRWCSGQSTASSEVDLQTNNNGLQETNP